MTRRIEDYALIGDTETAALVCRDGSIDWLCWPRFDSGAVFASMLGSADNGCWRIAAVDDAAQMSRRYLGDTLVLETRWQTDAGAAAVIDFMPLRIDGNSHVVRIVRGERGRVAMKLGLVIRSDYGSVVPWVTRIGDNDLMAIAGPDRFVLRSPIRLTARQLSHVARFEIGEGEEQAFVLSYGSSFAPQPAALDPAQALERTTAGWQEWAGRYRGGDRYASHVRRSLITLKALTYAPTGGIVAAPTTSLPEHLGGARNWDYRFCWLRDSTFTLMALLNCGYSEEADAWRRWLRHAVAGAPAQVQIMYGLSGERRIDEWEVPWLRGFEGSTPVRVGNAAARQLQLDIFGEVMDTLFQSQHGGLAHEIGEWNVQRKLVGRLEDVWREPDEGLWEVRGGRRHFTHSKVMAWVALDRAVRSIEHYGLDGPLRRWRELRDEIHATVCREGYDQRIGAFVQSFGSSHVDASALLLPLVGFLPYTDPRVVSTVAVVRSQLMRHGLVWRYDTGETDDGLAGGEGAFLACSFWYVDNLVMQGRRDEATEMFERLLALANDVGLLSEEYDPVAGRMLGNFPQAFSHVAIINTAHNLARRDKPAEQRSDQRAPRDRSG